MIYTYRPIGLQTHLVPPRPFLICPSLELLGQKKQLFSIVFLERLWKEKRNEHACGFMHVLPVPSTVPCPVASSVRAPKIEPDSSVSTVSLRGQANVTRDTFSTEKRVGVSRPKETRKETLKLQATSDGQPEERGRGHQCRPKRGHPLTHVARVEHSCHLQAEFILCSVEHFAGDLLPGLSRRRSFRSINQNLGARS